LSAAAPAINPINGKIQELLMADNSCLARTEAVDDISEFLRLKCEWAPDVITGSAAASAKMHTAMRFPMFFVLASIGLSAPAATMHPRLTEVSFRRDIAPIIERRCTGCHTEGGFAPMALTRYENARDWSRAISEQTIDGRMPPWPAAVGVGDFSNDRSLTPVEIELLTSWAEGGAEEGTEAPQRPVARSEERTPDLILDLPHTVAVRTPSTRFELPIAGNVERWITGWAFYPSERARVERAVLGIADDGRVAAWVPPETSVLFRDGVAFRLPARATLTIDVHYRKGSAPPAPGGRVALFFGNEPRHELRSRTLPCGSTVLDEAIDLIAIEPTVNHAGATIEAVAHRPDRSVEPLILVRRFLTWYVPAYRFRSAVRLPRGSRIDARASAGSCAVTLEYVAVR
jgi:hypothetical protein